MRSGRSDIPLYACLSLLLSLTGLLLAGLLLAACGPASPTEPLLAPTSTLAPTGEPPTAPPPTATTGPQIAATTTAAPPPDTAALKATVIAGLPPTPTPPASGDSLWGDVEILPLDTAGDQPLWAAFTVGMGFYDWEHGHTVSIYTHGDEGWQILGRVALTDCAEYINPESLRQVYVEPSRIWLELESYTGAHGGCYDLFSFDGQALRHEVSHFNSSPAAGNLADLDGDGLQEVILNWTENYVFCYACGVRLPMFDVLRWDGDELVEVNLAELSDTAPAELRALNNRAVTLARATLWKDAGAAINLALAVDAQDPTVAWNAILIAEQVRDLREQVDSGSYPLLSNVFYGDHAAAVDVMRAYNADEIWGVDSPLIVGTVAEGWEMALTDWISMTTGLALEVQPALAPAHFLRAWAIHLTQPGDPQVLSHLERAVQLSPGDALYSTSLAYLAGETPVLSLPTYSPLPPDTCHELGQAVMSSLQVTVTIQPAPFHDYVGGGAGTGCQISALGTGAGFESVWAVADQLEIVLAGQNWWNDLLHAADGLTGTARGFTQADGLCLLSANWEPAPEANCPQDQPISACELLPEQQLYTILLNCARETAPLPTPQVRAPTPTPRPTATPPPAAEESWQVRTLLAGPGEPGRLYALLTEPSSGAWPAERVAFLISDDYGRTWSPFPGGLPAGGCIRDVNLDYATPDALYASTCQGLYRWRGAAWELLSPLETGMVAVVYGDPRTICATDVFGEDGVVVRSDDGGASWTPASYGLIHFNGVANIGIDPRDANTLYAVIWPKYGGSYLRRGTAAGQWQVMPTPLNGSQIDTGITIDGATGTLYVAAFASNWQLWRALNPREPDINAVRWELVHDFGPDVAWASLLASGWSPQGLAIYANLSPWLDKASGATGGPVLHRSQDGGQTWNPLPLP